jgi:peptidoglycan/xylan/chitin deacetylase (PgdA/CDA1 family)
VPKSGPLVVCYHAVSDGWQHTLSTSPATLARQLALLMRWYRPMTAGDVLGGDRRGLHVTFDDAYRSIARALPVLRRLGVPATVFACSDYAEEGRPLAVPELAVEAAAHPAELATMRWDELRALAEDGIEIGSHTVSHAHLTRLDGSQLERELTESRQRIEDELERPCRYLAYPYGEENEHVRAAARKAGYVAAFAISGDVRRVDPFAIPRLGLWRDDHLLRTVAKIAFAYGKDRAAKKPPT